MRRIFYLMGVLMVTLNANAAVGDTFALNDLTYTVLTEDAGTSTGTVSVKAANTTISGAVVIPETVTNGGVSYTVTAFESRAFRTCEEITSVSVPNTLTNWDTDRIFSTCTKLVDVNIPEGVTVMQMSTFNTCPSLGHITLPESLGNLSGAMFYSSHVQRLTIKNRNITFNGSNGYGDAFDVYSCVDTLEFNPAYNLYERWHYGKRGTRGVRIKCFDYPEDNPFFKVVDGNHVYNKDMTILYQCGGIHEEYVAPASLELVYEDAFKNDSALVRVDLSKSKVSVIDEGGFAMCPNLTTIVWSDCIESLGYCAFSRSPNLDFTIPSTLRILGESAFAQNKVIQHLFVPNFIEGWSTFEKNNPTKDGIPYESQQFSSGVYEDVRWEAGISKITEGQVQSNKSLRTLYIPNSVKTIQAGAFGYCDKLTHVTLPSFLDSIFETAKCKFATPQYGVIEKDPKITEFTIPAYVRFVRRIQPKSTDNNLRSIFVMGDTIPLWHEKTIYQESVNGKGEPITIYVKKSVYDAHYPTGKWSQTWTYPYGIVDKTSTVEFDVSYEVPVTMTNAQGEGIMYKTLCRDFDVDLRHTNDNLPEGVEPLRAYLVDDVDGELRMVFLNEIKYIPSRLKANVEGYEDVDEYVGVVLKGTPGYTYYYRIGENDYTQGASGQWLMEQAMAASGSTETNNLMSGWAHDDRFIPTTEEDEKTGGTIVNYGLNQNRFKIYSNEGWLTYNKSFLQLPKSVSDAIERNRDSNGFANLTMVFNNSDGTTDKVSLAEFTRNAEDDIFYNPYGQQVKADSKGIVISGGRKYFNK